MEAKSLPVYLDCNATTPIEPRVLAEVVRFMEVEYGNAGSRTHEYGTRAKLAVQRAREQVAAVVASKPEEVVFTSGATESDNLAILGLQRLGEQTGRRHVISSQAEHKAVLEPLAELGRRGFEVTLLPVCSGGYVEPDQLRQNLRPDTLLVSLMHVNNETGVEQPVEEYLSILADHSAYLHVDAAQGFGKRIPTLRHERIDLLSVSGHKIYGPKGVGALVARRRGFKSTPLTALQFGGGQERGLKPGTLPVPLIAGLGEAALLAASEAQARSAACAAFKGRAIRALDPLSPVINGAPARCLPHVLNISIPGLDAEAIMVATKDLIAISNGSACTSATYEPSHVLVAMGLPPDRIAGALRLSWCHTTPDPDWSGVVSRIRRLQ